MIGRFVLRRENERVLIGEFDAVKGFFVGYSDCCADFEGEWSEEWPDPLTFTVSGFRLDPALAETIERSPEEYELGNAYLEVRDDSGTCMGSYWVGGVTVEELSPSEQGNVDATLIGWVTTHCDIDAAAVWDSWRHGPPTEANQNSRIRPTEGDWWWKRRPVQVPWGSA